jgi:hypothetical protein
VTTRKCCRPSPFCQTGERENAIGGKTARGRSLLSCGVTGCLDFGMDGQT